MLDARTRRETAPVQSDRAPLSGDGARWVPHLPVDVASRVEFPAPLASGYSDLLELHNALRYRLAPALRFGGSFEARFGAGTLLFGTGAVLSTGFPLASRWVTTLDAEYRVPDILGLVRARQLERPVGARPLGTPRGGATPRRAFQGTPSLLDSGNVGPLASVEYLFVPNQHSGTLVVGGGLFFRHGF